MSKESIPSDVLFDFVVEHADKEPLSRRVIVYRSAARLLNMEPLYKEKLLELAERLEAIENSTRELKLSWRNSQS